MSQYMVARERADGSGIDYPPLLPSDRKDRSERCIHMVIIILLCVGSATVCYDKGTLDAVYYVGFATMYAIFLAGIAQVLLRICLLCEEVYHIPVRYYDIKAAVLAAFDANMWTRCVLGLSFFAIFMVIITVRENPFLYMWRFGAYPNVMVFILSYLLSHLIGMEQSTLHTSLQITKMSSLDYGSGMAYNFFYGYLRLVLSVHEIGTQSKGIIGRIETYINKQHLYDHLPECEPFPIKKLFILIPNSLHTPTDLKQASKDDPNDGSKCWMEAAPSLEAEVLDRAGVKQREYKNSVYKIRDPDAVEGVPYVYVVAEGATPLKTLWDVITMNPKMSAVFKKHKEEIVSSFYKTLLEILNESDDCQGLCEVIYYVDSDVNKKKVNVAKVILERIEELKQKQRHEEMNGFQEGRY